MRSPPGIIPENGRARIPKVRNAILLRPKRPVKIAPTVHRLNVRALQGQVYKREMPENAATGVRRGAA
jgi:hypothetical protein